MNGTGLSIVGSGMLTALGNSTPATCAGLVGRIRAVSASNLWDATTGTNLALGRPKLHQWWEGADMLGVLAASTVRECTAIAHALTGEPASNIPVALLVAPPWRPWRWPDLEARALLDLSRCLDAPLPSQSVLIAGGSTGFFAALSWARNVLAQSRSRFCVVVGVESYLRQVLAEEYLAQHRLLTLKNSNGFSPGEGAAAVLLARTGTLECPELAILGAGFAHDPSGAGGNDVAPVTGNGLTDAMRQALQQSGHTLTDMELRFSDANGEHFKFREVAIADSRLLRLRSPQAPPRRVNYFQHWHPIEYIGEVGAAIMPLMLGYAYDGGLEGYLPGPLAIMHASEDNGDRTAYVVQYRDRR